MILLWKWPYHGWMLRRKPGHTGEEADEVTLIFNLFTSIAVIMEGLYEPQHPCLEGRGLKLTIPLSYLNEERPNLPLFIEVRQERAGKAQMVRNFPIK